MTEKEYGHNRKKVVFYSTDKAHADMKLRLKYDGLTQSSFFRGMIDGYINKDPAINDFIDRLKEKEQVQGAAKREHSNRLLQEGARTKNNFGLDETELENIFDIIEKEHPEI
jgi:hypothetical protein